MGLSSETENRAHGDIREQYQQAKVLIDRFEVKITTACKQVGLHRQTYYHLQRLEAKRKARPSLDKGTSQEATPDATKSEPLLNSTTAQKVQGDSL